MRRGEGRDGIAVFKALLEIAAENESIQESGLGSPLLYKDRKREQKQQKKAVYRGGSQNPKARFCRGILEPRARVELATCRLRIGCSTTELPRPIKHLRVASRTTDRNLRFRCVFGDLRHRLMQLLRAHDVVASEDCHGAMSCDSHCCALVYSRLNQIAGG